MSPVVWFVIGAALAGAFCKALAYNARLYLAGGSAVKAVFVHLGRWAAIVPAFVAIATLRGRALLPAAAGFALAYGALCLVVVRRRG
jgi:hypothetical protein